MTVGVIIDPHQAEDILQSGGADLVALGREIMHDPFWPLHAAETLGVDPDYRMCSLNNTPGRLMARPDQGPESG